jgi:hypothetical protein
MSRQLASCAPEDDCAEVSTLRIRNLVRYLKSLQEK